MNREDGLDCFHFHNDLVVDEEIDSVSKFNRESVVHNGKRLLAFKRKVEAFEFVAKARMVGPLEQSRSKSRVHSIGRAQDAVGDRAVDKIHLRARSRDLRGGVLAEQELIRGMRCL